MKRKGARAQRRHGIRVIAPLRRCVEVVVLYPPPRNSTHAWRHVGRGRYIRHDNGRLAAACKLAPLLQRRSVLREHGGELKVKFLIRL